jgi:hypothetical protein
MAAINNLSLVLHKIRVRLYPNYLPTVKGRYVARTDKERTLTTEDIVTTMITRGGFTGNPDGLLDHIRQYNHEVAYQLCDGYGVSNDYFVVYINIGGTFESANEAHDHKKNPISFRFLILSKLRELIRKIQVEIAGLADTNGYIDQFVDQEEHLTNSLFVPGNVFAVHGHKIKLAGDNPSVGVYFVPVSDPTKAVKVTRIVDNSPSRIMGVAPNTGCLENHIEIRTQFSPGASLLKTPRIITSAFVLEKV